MPIQLADVDRLLAPDFVEGLESASMEDVRARRNELEEAETAVSYLRRLVQARIDLIHAEQRRRSRGESDIHALVEELPSILSEGGRTPGPGRLPQFVDPGEMASALTDEIDRVAPPEQMADLAVLDEAQLGELESALGGLEREVSERRRRLHERLDAIHEEIIRRYRDGEANVDTLLR
ncbi:MAG TPA: hypothetical protein VFH45_00470 [Acidimicrobiales bacterium]|nr:hypothetical protein [Acidimicrobiales bacterium]